MSLHFITACRAGASALAKASRVHRPLLATGVALTLTLGAGRAHADEDAQRDALARIAYELARLEEANARTRFRFDWLARDLSMVRQGIEDHLNAPRQPRPVPALRGDYRP